MSLDRRSFVAGSVAAVGGAVAASVADAQIPEGGGITPTPFTELTFTQPYIDKDEWRDAPVRHRYVHGGFTGTAARFSFYFPVKEQYQGRFFQLVNPVPSSENTGEAATGEESYICFAIASGGYYVQTNQGGLAATGSPGSPIDPSIAAYRVSAAAAEYSRTVARQMYGGRRPYGYCFGGSGGAYRTIGGFEQTSAWDGAVPFVMGTNHAIPSMFTCRLHGLRTVGDKMALVVDALDAGGSGDMYAGLNEEERAGLREATRMGFPPRTWFLWKTMGWGPFSNLHDLVVRNDPSYFTDFWTKPGYLGANPPDSLKRARLQHRSPVKRIIMTSDAAAAGIAAPGFGGTDPARAWQNFQDQWGSRPFPVAFELDNPPPPAVDLQGSKIVIDPDGPNPGTVSIGRRQGDIVTILFSPVSGAQVEVTGRVRQGDRIQLDNSDVLAVQTYHRHVVPPPDFYVWNQFRGPDGKPIYPQRPRTLGPMFTTAAAGAPHTGKWRGKMIVVETLMDEDALPWQADWYRNKVRANLGARIDDHYRLWYIDHALHGSAVPQSNPTRTVSYRGALYQALRDVSAWVERGAVPPRTTNYKVEDGQVIVPPAAAQRAGVQPVVALTANGRVRADVKVGQAVEFVGIIESPPGTGSVVEARWDFDGSGKYATPSTVTPAPRVEVRQSQSFDKAGTYFVTLKATGQRNGDAKTPYGRIYNIARARVVVT